MADRGIRARTSVSEAQARKQLRSVALVLMPALLLGVLAIPLAGCGSSGEDIASKPAAAILAASRTAAQKASAVHVKSQFYATAVIRSKAKGKKTKTKLLPVSTLELQLTSDGGRARVTLLGRKSEAVRVADTIYAKSSPAFYTSLARRTGVHVAPGTWLKAPANGAQLTEYTALTEPSGELMLLLRNPTLSLTKGHTTTIKGQKAIELKTEGKLYDGAIYIAATGTPYPIEIVEHGRETGQTTFTAWNDPVTITPPANAVELSGLERHAKR